MNLPTILEQPTDQLRESAAAKWWRMHVARLTVQELAELSGYTTLAIYLMEKGVNSQGACVKPWVWRRYKLACAGVDAYLRSKRHFGWGQE